jgi:hypothetical protein
MLAPITCAPDCDHHEYAPAVAPRDRSDETSCEGSEDGDLY